MIVITAIPSSSWRNLQALAKNCTDPQNNQHRARWAVNALGLLQTAETCVNHDVFFSTACHNLDETLWIHPRLGLVERMFALHRGKQSTSGSYANWCYKIHWRNSNGGHGKRSKIYAYSLLIPPCHQSRDWILVDHPYSSAFQLHAHFAWT